MNNWLAAFGTIGEVAATLTGLLFVSLSVKLNTASSEGRQWMLFVAKRSFLDFLAVLVVGLLFLMPDISLHAIGWGLVWLSVARVVWHVNHWRIYRATSTEPFRPIEYLASIAATLLLTVAGVTAFLGWAIAPQLTYVGAITLLFGSCQNAWRLLVR
jgi:hypothetical protein